LRQVGVEAALLHQRQQVVEAGIGEVDLRRLGLQGGQLGGAQLPLEGRALAGPAQQSTLRFRVGKPRERRTAKRSSWDSGRGRCPPDPPGSGWR
jgi:hypothetical protein